MALIIIGSLPLLIFFSALGINKTTKTQKISDEKWSELSGIAYDSISNIFLVKSFTLRDKIIEKISQKREYAYIKQKEAIRWWGFINGVTRSVGFILSILVFLSGSYLFTKNEISLGTIVMFLGFSNILISIFNSMFWNIIEYLWQKEKINAFFEIWEQKPKIVDKDNAIKVGRLKGDIEFKNVSFSYGDKEDALNNISFKINSGEMIAFVGHTGSGKTTTANLISRFYETKKGKILVDGLDIKKINIESLRKNIAIVFQENTFFNASLLDNLKIDNEQEITEEGIEESLRKARISHILDRSKEGINQVIGERGSKLSGGEKQRLSIARAILKDAPILVLDEATSALDAKTENEIQLAISNLIKDKTTIVIAHRLSTIKKADRIFVFENGKIIETGTFNSLMKEKGKFYELASYQIAI
jgi:ATP-binding cassette subfamily B protein